jgi:hypothetical protein
LLQEENDSLQTKLDRARERMQHHREENHDLWNEQVKNRVRALVCCLQGLLCCVYCGCKGGGLLHANVQACVLHQIWVTVHDFDHQVLVWEPSAIMLPAADTFLQCMSG